MIGRKYLEIPENSHLQYSLMIIVTEITRYTLTGNLADLKYLTSLLSSHVLNHLRCINQ